MSLVSSYHVECFCDNCQNMKIDTPKSVIKKKPLKIKSIIKSILKRLVAKSAKKTTCLSAKEFEYSEPEIDNMRNYMQDQFLALTPEEEDNRLNELNELEGQIAVVLLVPSWNYNVPDCDICARGDFNPVTVRQIPQAQI